MQILDLIVHLCKAFLSDERLTTVEMPQYIIISGPTTAQNMSSRRRRKILQRDSLGPGIFGWLETHEQLEANIVARQLQSISHIDRSMVEDMHAGVFKSVELLLDSARRLLVVRDAACV